MNNEKLYLEKHTREVNFCHVGYSLNYAKHESIFCILRISCSFHVSSYTYLMFLYWKFSSHFIFILDNFSHYVVMWVNPCLVWWTCNSFVPQVTLRWYFILHRNVLPHLLCFGSLVSQSRCKFLRKEVLSNSQNLICTNVLHGDSGHCHLNTFQLQK